MRALPLSPRIAPFLAVLGLALACPLASAQDTAEARYTTAITRALQEFESGHYEEARAFFRQAHREVPNPRTLRGIAMASYELRDYTEAFRSAQAALAFGPSDRDLTPEHRASVSDLVDRTRALIGVMTGIPREGAVRVDGATRALEPDGTLLLVLGPHRVVVTMPDGRETAEQVTIAGGETVAFTVVEVAPVVETPPPVATPPPPQQELAAQPSETGTGSGWEGPPSQEEPAPQEGRGVPRFRLNFAGFVGVGSYSSLGASYGAVPAGGAIGALVQVAEIFAIGAQIGGSYASLFESRTYSDTSYWAQTDILAWGELRFGPLGIGIGAGVAIGAREESTYPLGIRQIGSRTDVAFGLVGDVRVYFADDFLFLAAEGRFAFGDYSATAGVLAIGVEPLR